LNKINGNSKKNLEIPRLFSQSRGDDYQGITSAYVATGRTNAAWRDFAVRQKAGEMGIKSETASTWLKRMQKHGLVENVDGKGNYRKPKV